MAKKKKRQQSKSQAAAGDGGDGDGGGGGGLESWKRCQARLKTAQRHMKNVKLHAEMFLMDRLVYKYSNQLKRERSFQLLRKLRKIAARIDELEPTELPQRYLEVGKEARRQKRSMSITRTSKPAIANPEGEGSTSTSTVFPTLAMEQEMATLQGLLQQAEVVSERAAAECKVQLEKGLFMPFHLVVLSNASRTWSMCKFTAFTLEHIQRALAAFAKAITPSVSAAALVDTPAAAVLSETEDEEDMPAHAATPSVPTAASDAAAPTAAGRAPGDALVEREDRQDEGADQQPRKRAKVVPLNTVDSDAEEQSNGNNGGRGGGGANGGGGGGGGDDGGGGGGDADEIDAIFGFM
ncbi:hypothetical protein PTSG_11629 [Salpingoeca rosetta]|uniref:Nucleolus and neural progenitor protein-like N-terminal domain-containing protein n=1 Tax=Salpingoeca rosetta (strain ATCC 50818 / BSB-021) TaxID=946362 RepID=F2TX78_SALR5|nr:uncharacterized protein PTSG_11629 [Salpingoeca rosetta]EGD75987.1 hypothetical protein PTSG_11629 [Salpingoeca rosetta]|eukprot:XP_004998162.1 hypothetical protein PTSG_11629 [Salpingoeca rosetta]